MNGIGQVAQWEWKRCYREMCSNSDYAIAARIGMYEIRYNAALERALAAAQRRIAKLSAYVLMLEKEDQDLSPQEYQDKYREYSDIGEEE